MTPSITSSPAIDTAADGEVAAGIAWLDEHQPGWDERIDLGSLNLQDDRNCIACQVAGIHANFFGSVRHLGISKGLMDMGMLVPSRCCRNFITVDEWYANADRLWRAEILRRRSPGADAGGMEGQES
jgi:hypothetical protein